MKLNKKLFCLFLFIFFLLRGFTINFADAQVNLEGKWRLKGSDLENLIGAEVKFKEITVKIIKNGSGYQVLPGSSISLDEIGCIGKSTQPKDVIVKLISTGKKTFQADTFFYLPVLCFLAPFGLYDVFIKNVSLDSNSITTCRSDEVNDCATWKRVN